MSAVRPRIEDRSPARGKLTARQVRLLNELHLGSLGLLYLGGSDAPRKPAVVAAWAAWRGKLWR